jgi:3',5'-cyclic AMP phosphodiesterase CpdA
MSYRFVVISDTHFIAPGHRMVGRTWWNRVLESRCEAIGAALGQAVNRLKPDFVIHCGDFTGHSDPVNYEFGLQVMSQLGCPWYAVLGNHDTWGPGVRAALAARYQLPGEDCFYARDLAGLRFIFLDVAYWTSTSGETSPYLDHELYDRGQIRGMGPSQAELVWLEHELAAADRPVVLVSHAPLGYKPAYPIPTLPYGTPALQPQTSIAELMGKVLHLDTLREMIRRHRQVKIALAGHWHICDMIREDGVTFCQTASLREYPFEFRVVDVADGNMVVNTLGLGDDFQRESYVEAWGNRWIAGADEDRSFLVELK